MANHAPFRRSCKASLWVRCAAYVPAWPFALRPFFARWRLATLETVDCYGRHPHHHGGSDQHQKRLERGFSGFCHDHPPLPALGFGVSLSMASGACASTGEASANTPPPSQNHEIFLGEEEISDVSLATFYVFDKENAGPPPLSQKLRLAAGCGAVAVAVAVPAQVYSSRNLSSLRMQRSRDSI
jgi:hypothetical protein